MKAALSLGVLVGCILVMSGCSPVPSSPSDLRTQVDEFRRAGHPAQALMQAELLARQTGWTHDLSGVAGDLRYQLGDMEGAAALWQRIELPGAERLRDLARALLMLQRWGEAQVTIEAVLALDSNDAWARLYHALLMLPMDESRARADLAVAAQDPVYTGRAGALIQVLSDVDDNRVVDLMQVGLILVEQAEWAMAEGLFDQAAALSGEPEAMAALGFVRTMQGKDGALELLTAVTMAPDSAPVRYWQGITARQTGDLAASVDALALAVRLEPANPAYYVELARTYRESRDLEQAEAWYQRAVEVSGNDPRYREILALFYADEAPALTTNGVSVLEALADDLPNSADVRAGYGWALYTAGSKTQGRALLEQALAADPENARASFYLGSILVDEGDTTAALPLLRRVAQGTSAYALPAQALLDSLE